MQAVQAFTDKMSSLHQDNYALHRSVNAGQAAASPSTVNVSDLRNMEGLVHQADRQLASLGLTDDETSPRRVKSSLSILQQMSRVS